MSQITTAPPLSAGFMVMALLVDILSRPLIPHWSYWDTPVFGQCLTLAKPLHLSLQVQQKSQWGVA